MNSKVQCRSVVHVHGLPAQLHLKTWADLQPCTQVPPANMPSSSPLEMSTLKPESQQGHMAHTLINLGQHGLQGGCRNPRTEQGQRSAAPNLHRRGLVRS